DLVQWVSGDVTEIDDIGPFDLWHDRAVFHFLVSADDRQRYLDLMERTVPAGGHVIMATFALDGPDRCSGLDVRRYDLAQLSAELGPGYERLDDLAWAHVTPRGVEQHFTYGMFRRA